MNGERQNQLGKELLKCPLGEKSHLVKTRSWGCVYVLILRPRCHACSVYKSEWVSRSSQQRRVFQSSSCSVQLHERTGTLGRLAPHTWRQETQHGSITSAYDLASSTTHFPPNNVGKLNENHSKDNTPCVCWLEEGRLVKWASTLHAVSLGRAQPASVKIRQTVGIWGTVRLNTPRRV